MPLWKRFTNGKDDIGLWQITDNEFPVDLMENHASGAFRSMHRLRLRQRLACLQLVGDLAGTPKEVSYDKHGKPFLINDPRQISFSHCGPFAAVMLTSGFAGIDFELIRPKVLNILHKFLNEPELASLNPSDCMDHAHVYWGAKEAVYKVYGKQELLFKTNILIEPFQYSDDKGSFSVRLQTPDCLRHFHLNYVKIDGYMLVHIVNNE